MIMMTMFFPKLTQLVSFSFMDIEGSISHG